MASRKMSVSIILQRLLEGGMVNELEMDMVEDEVQLITYNTISRLSRDEYGTSDILSMTAIRILRLKTSPGSLAHWLGSKY
jgi:hypothetical protein